MNCNECSNLLSHYIDNEINDVERKQVEEHLAKCSKCQCEHQLLKKAIECVCNLECVEPPEDFHERLMVKIKKECEPNKIIWPFWGSLSLGSLAAAALLLLALIYNPFKPSDDLPEMVVHKLPANNTVQANVSTSNHPEWEAFKKEKEIDQSTQTRLASQQPTNPQVSPSLVKQVAFGNTVKSTLPRVADKVNKQLLYRQNHEWTGEDSKVTTKKDYRIRMADQAEAVWQETGITPIPLSTMNWTKNELIALFIGAQPGRGYEIQIKNIEKKNQQLIVHYFVSAPISINNTTSSNPFIIFETEKSNLPITFIQD